MREIVCGGCGETKKYYAKGLCRSCYRRINRDRWGKVIICEDCKREKIHYGKGRCRPCYQRYWQQKNPEYGRRWREENREKVRDINRRSRKRHREKRLMENRRWRKQNPEYQRRWYKANSQKVIGYVMKWRRQNPRKVLAINARWYARKRGLPNTLTSEQVEHLFAIGEATYPGQKLHLDHMVPLSKGGGTTLANVHAIPASLNCSKYDKLPQDVYVQLRLKGSNRKK